MPPPSPHLEIVEGANRGQFLNIPEHGARIGRAPENDFKLDDAALSRFQCRLFFRDGGLWIADLGSTNATLVNNRTVQESMLRSGDIITVGETDIRVLRSRLEAGEPEPRTSLIVSRPVSDNELDLGLDSPALNETGTTSKRKHVPGFLWIITAAIVLLAGLIVVSKVLSDMRNPQNTSANNTTIQVREQPLQFEYEKVIASSDNIYRFALDLDDGKLAMQMDDLRDNRKATRRKTISEELVKELRQDLADTRFFESRSEYLSRSKDGYESIDLSVSIGAKTHRARTLNQLSVPEELAEAIGIIDAFAETEFGLKALSQPPEKLKELAEASFQTGLKSWSERNAAHANLWDAIKDLQQVEYYLETIDDKPDYYADALDLLKEARAELEGQIENLNFQVEKARQTSQWEAAAEHLRTICLLVPDRNDPRHEEAQSMLNMVQQRIRR